MLKYWLFLIFTVFIYSGAECCTTDTAKIFYKTTSYGYEKVGTKDSSDFIRLIYPDDVHSKGYSVSDYYKSGKLKFNGKTGEHLVTASGMLALEGDCVDYFENGKRKSICHYNDGHKDGKEYLYYPSGKLYAVRNETLSNDVIQKISYLECYDANGVPLAKNGNGTWILYDPDFKNAIMTGPIKKGERNGERRGRTMKADSVKYIINIKMGLRYRQSALITKGKVILFNKI